MTQPISFLGNDDLDQLYGPPGELVQRAIKNHLTDFHIDYLRQATFFVIASGSATGLDASPRGGSAGMVQVLDKKRVCFADWPGNNRIETLRNIVRDPRIGMVFLFPGLDIFMRINGRAGITTDEWVLDHLLEGARRPKTAIVVTVDDVLFHCGKAINRAGLWDPAKRIDRKSVPSPGIMMKQLAEIEDVSIEEFDAHYAHAMHNDLYE